MSGSVRSVTSQRMRRETNESIEDLRLAAQLQLERSPYLTLGGAFALGWILGGGISPRLLALGLSMGGRYAAGVVAKQALARVAEFAREGSGGNAARRV
jgi:hypothetical protein